MYTYNTTTNNNVNRLKEIIEYQLLAANTQFQKKKVKLWTWISPHKTKHQIDYIIDRKKWRKSIRNCEAYNTFISLGSDHRIVVAKVILSLRATKLKMKIKPKYVWSELRDQVKLQEKYANDVKEKFNIQSLDEESLSKKYERLVEAINETAPGCMRQITKPIRKLNSDDPRIIRARNAISTAYKTNTGKKGHSNLYKQKKFEMYQIYKEINDEDLEKKVLKIEQADRSMRYLESWSLINEIPGRKSSQTSQLNGNSDEDRVNQWYIHFRNLLGNSTEATDENEEILPVFEKLPINDDVFTPEEYSKATMSIKCGKIAGEDGIMPDLLKYVQINDIMLDIINNSFENCEQPDLWNISNIIHIPKSGNLTKTDNYRGISLTSIMAKTYNRMLLNRIRPILDPLLRNNQNGFRQERTTVGQILSIRSILEGVKSKNVPVVFTFIDFKKAFDSVNRGKMIKILRSYGIPDKIVNAIEASYDSTRAKVYSPDGVTEEFDIVKGVLQGDTLSPYLFVIILDYALRKAIKGREEELGFTIVPSRSRRVHPIVVTDLDFADDIALISDSVRQSLRVKASELLQRVESECSKVGLLMLQL